MEAEASFNTEIASISCGLIIFISPGIPSTKTSGVFPPFVEEAPRTFKSNSSLPGCPDVR